MLPCRLGRSKTLLTSLTLSVVFGVLVCVSPYPSVFIVMRFCLAAASAGVYLTLYISRECFSLEGWASFVSSEPTDHHTGTNTVICKQSCTDGFLHSTVTNLNFTWNLRESQFSNSSLLFLVPLMRPSDQLYFFIACIIFQWNQVLATHDIYILLFFYV